MTATTTAAAAVGSDAAFLPQARTDRTARFDVRWGRSGVVVTVHGEVDAANAAALADFVRRCAGYCEWLVLDLSGLRFIGTAALPRLQQVEDRCTAVGVSWSLVPGPAAARMLRFCQPGRLLPVSDSLTDALATVQSRRRRLQLVTS